jgi:N-glycosylase/DNA lyase
VLLDSRAEELTDVAVAQARGNLRYLKSVVPQIAQSHNVSTSALANYLAFRLSLQNENWWGAAHNLQEENKSCWVDAINNFFNNIKFNRLEGNVRELFIRTINYENAQ